MDALSNALRCSYLNLVGATWSRKKLNRRIKALVALILRV